MSVTYDKVINQITASLTHSKSKLDEAKTEYDNIRVLKKIVKHTRNHNDGQYYLVPEHLKSVIEALGWVHIPFTEDNSVTYSIAQLNNGCDKCKHKDLVAYDLDYIICESPLFTADNKYMNKYDEVEINVSSQRKYPKIYYVNGDDNHNVDYKLLLKSMVNKNKLNYEYTIDYTRIRPLNITPIVGLYFSSAILVYKH